ncbi:MAG: hypothetical protein LUD22_04240 [Coprobacillus sp.]|nr:hypothetical protein [Coprobacillus sp.]
MKKTKLLTSIAALALVLGLGACSETTETPTESGTTSEETSEPTDTTPTEDGENNDEGEEETESYTLVFTLYDSSSAVQTCPEYGSLYIGGTFDDYTSTNWGTRLQLTSAEDESGNQAYSVTFTGLTPGASYTYMIMFNYEGDDAQSSWNPVYGSGNLSLTLPADAEDGGTSYFDVNGCYTLATQYPQKGSDVQFYILFTGISTTSTETHYINCGGNPFTTNTDGYYNYSAATQATTGTGATCLYSGVGTYAANTTDYFYIYESTDGGLDISTNTITIVENTSGYAVYVCDVSTNTKPSYNASWWHTNVTSIETLIQSL